jgi:hypothetical protein
LVALLAATLLTAALPTGLLLLLARLLLAALLTALLAALLTALLAALLAALLRILIFITHGASLLCGIVPPPNNGRAKSWFPSCCVSSKTWAEQTNRHRNQW